MGLIPWEKQDAITKRFPPSTPNANLVNAVMDNICPIYGQIIAFRRQLWSSIGAPAVADVLPIDEWIIGRMCPTKPPITPPLPPYSVYPVGCTSSGRLEGRVNVSSVQNPFWVEYSEEWTCQSNNVGLPISAPEWRNVGGNLWAWQQLLSRGPNDTPYWFSISAENGDPDINKVQMTLVRFTPCPGCNVPPPTTTPPLPPPRPPGSTPVLRPTINVPVTFSPTINGSLPITFNIPMEIKFGFELNVNRPILQVQPITTNAPLLGIYPTLEFNADGVSVDVGGVNIPINNEFNLINNASGGLTCEQLRECIEDLFEDEGECESYTTTVIGSGTTTIQNSVREYAFALNAYDFITLEITGTLPDGLSYVQTNKATGFWGGLAATYQGAHYEHTMVYSRQAATSCKGRPSDGVRLYLKPGLNFTLRGHKCNE